MNAQMFNTTITISTGIITITGTSGYAVRGKASKQR